VYRVDKKVILITLSTANQLSLFLAHIHYNEVSRERLVTPNTVCANIRYLAKSLLRLCCYLAHTKNRDDDDDDDKDDVMF